MTRPERIAKTAFAVTALASGVAPVSLLLWCWPLALASAGLAVAGVAVALGIWFVKPVRLRRGR